MSIDKAEKGLRVLHVAGLDYPPVGVLQQMQWEQDAAQELALNWQTCIYASEVNKQFDSVVVCERNTPQKQGLASKLLQKVVFNLRFLIWLVVRSREFDLVLLRYRPHDLLQFLFVMLCKRKILTVHHTIEPAELEIGNTRISRFRSWLDKLLGKLTLGHVEGVVAVTNEIASFQASRLKGLRQLRPYVYPNGVSMRLSRIEDDLASEHPDVAKPELLFVASYFSPWHGLDLLLASALKSQRDFVLHVVGTVPLELYEQSQRDPRLCFHGKLASEEVNALAARCCVGVSSLAMERAGLTEACTLKVREYLANGLPVYAGYNDVFPSDFAFFECGVAEIDAVIDYAISLSGASRADITAAALPYIDKMYLLKGFYTELQKSSLIP